MRVLLLNNYEMASMWRRWQEGICPGHHLWGATHFAQHGIDVIIPPFECFGAVNRYWRLQRLLGLDSRGMIALDQQIRALATAKVDLYYSACQDHSFLLAWLRKAGILRKPVVATLHHPVPAGSSEEKALASHDLLLCLSQTLRDDLVGRGVIDAGRTAVVKWGADIDFYEPYVPLSHTVAATPVVISAGKSNRDYDTLIAGATGLDMALEIYCSADSAPIVRAQQNLTVMRIGPRGTNPLSHVEMRDGYRRATAIAIPMPALDRLIGLSSLLDALALGRPVIMTRNRYVDLDVEKEGCGLLVEPGDASGWRSALRQVVTNQELASRMGQRARELAVRTYNIADFSREVANALSEVIARSRQRA